MSFIDEVHIFFDNLLNGLKLAFHPFDIFHGFGIIKLFFLLLDDTVKLDKIVTSLNAFKPGLQIVGTENSFGLIEKGTNKRVNKDID